MKKRNSSFWDDDVPDEPKPVATPPPKPSTRRFLTSAGSPEGFFDVKTAAGSRVVIIDKMNQQEGWEELLCYSIDLRSVVHLKRSSLEPKDKVAEICEFLQQVLK